MHPDLDDTRVVARGASTPAPATPDVEDTVVRIPDLVEPPEFERPALDAPAAQHPAAQHPAARHPAAQHPVVEHPAVKHPAVESPALEPPAAERGPDHPVVSIRGIATIPLDAPVVIGRRPGRTRIQRGPAPRLVTVPSPSKEISANHVQIRRHGTAIVVSDLKSTNGTIATLPGGPRRTLLRGESAVVIAGTIIELGDGVVVDILPPEQP